MVIGVIRIGRFPIGEFFRFLVLRQFSRTKQENQLCNRQADFRFRIFYPIFTAVNYNGIIMKKVVLLGASNRWQLINTVLILLISIANFILASDDEPLLNAIRIALLAGAFLLLIFLLLSSVKASKYAVRVVIDEDEIVFKTHFFGRPQQLKWQNIKSIAFHPYRISFRLANDSVDVSYTTLAKISVEIKESIRQLARQKGVEVSGG